ncbi:MAG: NYN domain-containing protein [Candidatus Methylomirabilales bacterium]
MSDERLKIAVFIDFDNIEIGVKTTLGGQFDVGAVLEAVKERGEVVTKIAYGDWTRATDYGRSMSQHAIHMVQRNLTPGGDKNGADINLALDALEMAFTHNHINAFVIVGGDSDFITLVEKLKQYDRKVFVVGGRSFTSQVMQKNCTEFVAYEDIVGVTSRGRHAGGRTRGSLDIAAAMPLVRRALKLLSDREMTPQLGLLKSTLLQLDSSFSERAYGAGSFRDFVEKLANAGYVALKGNDRSFQVELAEGGDGGGAAEQFERRPHRERRDGRDGRDGGQARDGRQGPPADEVPGERQEQELAVESSMAAPAASEAPGAQNGERLGPAEGYRVMAQAFSRSGANPRFPMYVRQFKQFMKTYDEAFDERRYGFAGILDALRFGQREGLFRLDRDRRGGVRVHPGPQYQSLTRSSEAAPPAEALAGESVQEALPPADVAAAEVQAAGLAQEPAPAMPEPAGLEVEPTPAPPEAEEAPAPSPSDATIEAPAPEEAPAEPAVAPRARKRAAPRTGTRAKKAPAATAGARKKAPARPRAKKSTAPAE